MCHDLLNDGSSEQECLFTTWKGIEFCQNYPPKFLFQIKNWPRKENDLNISRQRKFAQKKFAYYSPAFCLCRLRWLLFLWWDPTTDARIDRKAVLSNSSCLNHEVIYQQNPLLFLKIQASNEIIWFEMSKTDQRTPRQLSLLNTLHVSLSQFQRFFASSRSFRGMPVAYHGKNPVWFVFLSRDKLQSQPIGLRKIFIDFFCWWADE